MLFVYLSYPRPRRQVVDHHFEIRQRAAEQQKRLEDRAVQFRNIEKRLLMRFKVIGEDVQEIPPSAHPSQGRIRRPLFFVLEPDVA